MDVQQALDLLFRLPSDKQAEVFDFISFLADRARFSADEGGRLPLEQEPLCGLWHDRDEMADSLAYVRDLRRREWP